MAYISYSETGESPLQQLIGHNPAILEKWDELLKAFYKHSSFEPKLQEEVRRTIAYGIQCAQCMSFGQPMKEVKDSKMGEVVRFTKKMIQTSERVLKEDVEKLQTYFSDAEIAELCAFIAFGMGYARFGAALSVDVKTQILTNS